MRNERNAGRKPIVSDEVIDQALKRYEKGERISDLSKEMGISRQALYKRIKGSKNKTVHIEYLVDGTVTTLIEADFYKEQINVINYASKLSERAFGYEQDPDWDRFQELLEDICLKKYCPDNDHRLMLENRRRFSLKDLEDTGTKHGYGIKIEDFDEDPVFEFTKKDLILLRSDTDGFQMKALTFDRRYFVKSQAVIGGVILDDWAVEIIAASICDQLHIPCVKQKHCKFFYGSQSFEGVCSLNFELDGYTFVSFESLLSRMNRSSNDDEFIKLDAISKLKWCAKMLSEASGLDYEKTERYMIDLAVLDCLVGNVDRHTRNFGLFYDCNKERFEIPPVFDCGMGLFEHDSYKDSYKTFKEAMNNVYVAPYGEDPFDMLTMLKNEYDLKKLYTKASHIEYGDLINTEYALEYERRMQKLWQK